jgi:hypothetical protein
VNQFDPVLSEPTARARKGFHRPHFPFVSTVYRDFSDNGLKMLTTFRKSAQALRTGEQQRFYGTFVNRDFFLMADSRGECRQRQPATYNYDSRLPLRPSQIGPPSAVL